MEKTKKFWCHCIGNDGNTPKRRNMELTNLSELLPGIGNEQAKNPLWYEYDPDDKLYYIYVQLSDTVAVTTLVAGVISVSDMEQLQETDADLDAEFEKSVEKWLEDPLRIRNDDEKEEFRKLHRQRYDDLKKYRDYRLDKLRDLTDFDSYLIDGKGWISAATVRAYKEVQSPVWPVIEHLRNVALENRKAEMEAERERRRKAQEAEARRKAEAEAREQERLTQEENKFRNGENIAGSDVVQLCRRHGIAIHLRTVHNLQKVVVSINHKGQCRYWKQSGKRRPQLDGCYKTADELYKYLQTH